MIKGASAPKTGNISVPSVNLPSSSVSSVDVSLSGNTLTVNVDGKSDSVDMTPMLPLPFTGSVTLRYRWDERDARCTAIPWGAIIANLDTSSLSKTMAGTNSSTTYIIGGSYTSSPTRQMSIPGLSVNFVNDSYGSTSGDDGFTTSSPFNCSSMNYTANNSSIPSGRYMGTLGSAMSIEGSGYGYIKISNVLLTGNGPFLGPSSGSATLCLGYATTVLQNCYSQLYIEIGGESTSSKIYMDLPGTIRYAASRSISNTYSDDFDSTTQVYIVRSQDTTISAVSSI